MQTLPPPGMATAAGDTHPTGMHSCCMISICTIITYIYSGVRSLAVYGFKFTESLRKA